MRPSEAPKDEKPSGNVTQRGAEKLPPRLPVLEPVFAVVGFVGTGTFLAVVLSRHILPHEVFEFFRGGNSGGVLVGISLVTGLFAFPMFIVNLILGFRSWWVARLLLILCVWGMIVAVGSMM